VTFNVPAGACDCHTHIHGDPARFPFFAGRTYTPEMAVLHKALHLQRVVIVTPSVYGTDNAATLYGMQVRGADVRWVAVIDGQTPESALDAMDKAGVRGIRLNLATAGITDLTVVRPRFQAAAERLQRRQWHMQPLTACRSRRRTIPT
jgi:predicted TIM-barrel fold metal-dependent hydrolase